jgi:hypothetical protein
MSVYAMSDLRARRWPVVLALRIRPVDSATASVSVIRSPTCLTGRQGA